MTAWHGGYSRLNEKIFDSTKKSRLKEKILYSAKIFSTRGKNFRLGKKDSPLEKKISRPLLSIMACHTDKPMKAVRNDVSREKLRVRSREM